MDDEAQRRNSPTICKDSDAAEEVEKRGYIGQGTDPRQKLKVDSEEHFEKTRLKAGDQSESPRQDRGIKS